MISALQADSYEDACRKMEKLTADLEKIQPENGGVEKLDPILQSSSLRPQYADSFKAYFKDSSMVGTDTETLLSNYRLDWNIQAYDPKVIEAQVAQMEAGGEDTSLITRAKEVGKCVFDRERTAYRRFWWGESIGIERDCASNLARFLIDISGLAPEDIKWTTFVDVVKKLASEGVVVIVAIPALTIILYLLRLYAYVLGRAIEGLLNEGSDGVWIQRTWIEPWVWVIRR